MTGNTRDESMISRLSPVALLLLLLGIFGCESGRGTGISTLVHDSAGITIVENEGSLGPGEGGWLVDSSPILSIGTFQGDTLYQLFQVEGATRLVDGRIAVSNAGSGEIRFFDSEGRFLSAVGRKGEGPEEFQQPVLVGKRAGDTLVVVDGQLRRISLVHPDLGVVQSARISDEMGGGAFPQGMLADGTIIMGGGFFFSSSSGMELSSGFSRRSTTYKSAELTGEMATDFGEFPGSEFFMEVQSHGGGAVSMRARLIPFGKHAMQAVGPRRFFYASGDAWEIRAFGADGVLQSLYRLARDPVPVNPQDLEARIQEEVEESGDPSTAPEIRSDYEEMPVPAEMPAFASLHADLYGFLWVERYRRPGDDVPTFDILNPEGTLVGRAELPPGSEILEIGQDYLLVLHRDELDVERVRLFGLRRPEGTDAT